MSELYDKFVAVTKQQVKFYSDTDFKIPKRDVIKEARNVLAGIHQTALFILNEKEYRKFTDTFNELSKNFWCKKADDIIECDRFNVLYNVSLGNRVRELRKRCGLTQTELGEFSGLSQNSISSLEVGEYSPTAFNALKISYSLGCKFEDCFFLNFED